LRRMMCGIYINWNLIRFVKESQDALKIGFIPADIAKIQIYLRLAKVD